MLCLVGLSPISNSFADCRSHVQPIKYTCPRCGTHTCSLPCVKKHKVRALCSGVRNSAEYRKRADLATPSSIDKDFNFISGVERSLVRAESDAVTSGVNLAPARRLNARDARPKVEIEIEERGVTVIRAPKGMSRSKQNKTHWVNQQKSIMWTVEWICQDGEKVIGSCLEKRTIAEAYTNVIGKKKIKRKRKLTSQGDTEIRASVKHVKQQPEEAVTADDEINATHETTADSEVADAKAEDIDKKARYDILAGLCFYLHVPTTPSNHKCLIPLKRDDAVGTILEGRTILEYPTLYAMHQESEQLSAPLISLEQYEKQHGAEIPIDVVSNLEAGEVDEPDHSTDPVSVDPSKVMEVLARDLTG